MATASTSPTSTSFTALELTRHTGSPTPATTGRGHNPHVATRRYDQAGLLRQSLIQPSRTAGWNPFTDCTGIAIPLRRSNIDTQIKLPLRLHETRQTHRLRRRPIRHLAHRPQLQPQHRTVHPSHHPRHRTLFSGGPGATGRSYSDFPIIIESTRTRLLTLPTATVVHTGHGEDTKSVRRPRTSRNGSPAVTSGRPTDPPIPIEASNELLGEPCRFGDQPSF